MRSLLPVLALAGLAASAPSRKPGKDSSCEPFFYKGHDLSSLKMLEDATEETFIFKDTTKGNTTRLADDILGDGGMNSVRLRLWVDPPDGVCGLPYTLELAKRFQSKGWKIYLDFHFADSWADPQKQPIPAAWPTTLEPLAATLREYVKDSLLAFEDAGVQLSLVSLGNEIRHGTLWPVGYVDVNIQPVEALATNFTNLATLYSAARSGVADAVAAGASKPEVMIHVDNGWNQTLQERWYGALTATGLVEESDWDVFGVSFYPFYGTAATFENLRASLGWMADTYGKPIQVVETDYPAICNGQWNPIPDSSEPGIPYSEAGQVEWMADVIELVKEIPDGLGQGVWYWEPAWLNNTSLGSACNDALMFYPDFSAWPLTIGYSRPVVNSFL